MRDIWCLDFTIALCGGRFFHMVVLRAVDHVLCHQARSDCRRARRERLTTAAERKMRLAQIDFSDPKHPSGIRVRGGSIIVLHGHAQRCAASQLASHLCNLHFGSYRQPKDVVVSSDNLTIYEYGQAKLAVGSQEQSL